MISRQRKEQCNFLMQSPKTGVISLYAPGIEKKKVHEVKALWTRETQVVDEI